MFNDSPSDEELKESANKREGIKIHVT